MPTPYSVRAILCQTPSLGKIQEKRKWARILWLTAGMTSCFHSLNSLAMEPRISIITLGVADIDRALRFYHEGLSLPTAAKPGDGIVFFRTSGAVLALYPYEALAKEIGPQFAAGAMGELAGFSGVTIAHNVRTREDVDIVMAQAERAGAEIVKPAEERFWGGYSGYFSDPDGYLWEIAWGAFEIDEDGSLKVP